MPCPIIIFGARKKEGLNYRKTHTNATTPLNPRHMKILTLSLKSFPAWCSAAIRTQSIPQLRQGITLLILLLSTITAWAQKEINPTDQFTVTGQIETEMTFHLSDLDKFTKHKVNDVVITNHMGEKKGTAKNLTGILV